MLHKRIIVCLDVKDGRVVKGTRFEDLRDVGDPVELAARYEAEGADEIVFLDISASAEGRRTLLDVVQRTAERLFIPLTVGGGVSDLEGIGAALRAGADKVSINTAAVQNPELLREASVEFGRQCIVASIDARVEKRQIEIAARPQGAVADAMASPGGAWFRVFTHGGRTATELDAVTWAKQCEELGAGEVLLTSIDQDGSRAGYDLEMTARIVEALSVPVIASGGAGSAEHIRDAFLLAGADAALVAGIFHDGTTTIRAVKRVLAEAGISVRDVPPATRQIAAQQ
ncbi:MAG TPA: imidazole glycerol phosphate synthase subunit HisF [Longimicrobiales bacterium]|nr:imidazole glycerol phosphate synthase subunit HisF [Longimicrobiales bacterium]